MALTALGLGAIALAAGLGGLAGHGRRHELQGGLVAMAFCGIVAASGVVLAAMVSVGIATGGSRGGAPTVVDRMVLERVLTGVLIAIILVLGPFIKRSGAACSG